MTVENNYEVHGFHFTIDAYTTPNGEWSECPRCGLRPKVWVFDNGRSTACGCWNSRYDHFTIHAESIVSVYKRTGSTIDYDHDGLRAAWNHWCATGEVMFALQSTEDMS